MSYATEQEQFWAGKFGDDYVDRNFSEHIIASNIHLFSKIFARTFNVNSVVEFGANIGLNLRAIQSLKPHIQLTAIEINEKATKTLSQHKNTTVYQQSILEDMPPLMADLTLIKGVLIHINPDFLARVYDQLHSCSKRYICIVEYYNPSPVEVPYRGHHDRLFKRDFAGEMLDKHPDLNLVDYGFIYHRDSNFPADDLTWFLLEKISVTHN